MVNPQDAEQSTAAARGLGEDDSQVRFEAPSMEGRGQWWRGGRGVDRREIKGRVRVQSLIAKERLNLVFATCQQALCAALVAQLSMRRAGAGCAASSCSSIRDLV